MSKPDVQETGDISGILERVRKRRFGYLTMSLLILIIAYPYVQGDQLGQVLLSLITTLVMVMLIIAVGDKRKHLFIAIVLALPWFVFVVLNLPIFKMEYAVLMEEEIIFAILLFAYTTYRIFMHIIKSQEVTVEILFASICVYILIGITWATLYALVESLHPGSFMDIEGKGLNSGQDFLFFSYVTLTTVGYGNVEAITDQARSLASLEALMGQLYLTVMVARLVGLHISKPKAKEPAV